MGTKSTSAADDQAGAGAGPQRPGRVSAAALLCALQGAVTAGLGAFMLLLLATGERENVAQAGMGVAVVLVLAAVPLAAGHGLWRLRRWSRGPAVIVQLLALPVAGSMATAGDLWPLVAVAVAATAIAILGCLINPTATEALGIGPRTDAGPDTT